MIYCKVCGLAVKQITAGHLKTHQITIADYKDRYPGSLIIDPEISALISSKISGKTKSQEHKYALSKTISNQYKNGREANKGKLGKRDSLDTIERKQVARMGKTHSQETKDKIGNAHRGKEITQETIDKCQTTKKARIEKFGPYTPGVMTPGVMVARNIKLSEIARNRTPKQVAEKVRMMNEARRGQPISEEERENHRRGTIKWMVSRTTWGKKTKPEIEMEEFLLRNHIDFKYQFAFDDYKHPYDFILPRYNTIIEIDGPQHWKEAIYGVAGKTQEERDLIFLATLKKDAIENYQAGINGFNIYRILVGNSIYKNEHGHFLIQLKKQGFQF